MPEVEECRGRDLELHTEHFEYPYVHEIMVVRRPNPGVRSRKSKTDKRFDGFWTQSKPNMQVKPMPAVYGFKLYQTRAPRDDNYIYEVMLVRTNITPEKPVELTEM